MHWVVITAQHRPAKLAAHGELGWDTSAGRKALILGKVVLVTGVARQLGGRFVRRVQRAPDVDRVIAVDGTGRIHDGDELIHRDDLAVLAELDRSAAGM